MSNSKSSSDLINISGNKKTPENLIDQSRSTSTNQKSINDIPSILQQQQQKKTFSVGPPSDVLSRVQAFLPQLKNANEQLKTTDPKTLDIENVDEENGQYIEMNLGLGVYEEKKPGQSDSDSDDDEKEEEEKLILPNSSSDSKNMIEEL